MRPPSGSCEIVEEGRNGFKAAAGDAHALAGAMMRTMQLDEGILRTMGLEARQRIVERYSLEAVLDQWERLYGELLGTQSRRRRFAVPQSSAI